VLRAPSLGFEFQIRRVRQVARRLAGRQGLRVLNVIRLHVLLKLSRTDSLREICNGLGYCLGTIAAP
jgi:hypothetical protein